MRIKKFAKAISGVFSDRDGKSLETLYDIWREGATCNCRIDCCEGYLAMPDAVTGELKIGAWINGTWTTFNSKEEFDDAVAAAS